MSTPDVELAFATYIAAQIPGTWTLATNAFAGPERDSDPGSGVPPFALFVSQVGGAREENNDTDLADFIFQVTVRTNPESYAAGKAAIIAVADLLRRKTELTASGQKYTHVTTATPSFIHLGQAPDGAHAFVHTFIAKTEITS